MQLSSLLFIVCKYVFSRRGTSSWDPSNTCGRASSALCCLCVAVTIDCWAKVRWQLTLLSRPAAGQETRLCWTREARGVTGHLHPQHTHTTQDRLCVRKDDHSSKSLNRRYLADRVLYLLQFSVFIQSGHFLESCTTASFLALHSCRHKPAPATLVVREGCAHFVPPRTE
ncbi:uncharacterized protein LOC135102343 [Scylla paramamosain]|uniref:uncharacterized protein LOC135102343 n=1 Tax=Scylla paramamosain TaxID=85552 RepID=UPI003083C1BE